VHKVGFIYKTAVRFVSGLPLFQRNFLPTLLEQKIEAAAAEF
jgi:hypothetical protein